MLSRAVVVTTIAMQLRRLGEADHVVFELARGNVPDARHESDLMVDEDEGRVLGGQRFVGADLIGHG
jgi:hypothetical protein